MVPFAHATLQSVLRWHRDLLSRFCNVHPCAQRTDRHTDHATQPSVATGRVYAVGIFFDAAKKNLARRQIACHDATCCTMAHPVHVHIALDQALKGNSRENVAFDSQYRPNHILSTAASNNW